MPGIGRAPPRPWSPPWQRDGARPRPAVNTATGEILDGRRTPPPTAPSRRRSRERVDATSVATIDTGDADGRGRRDLPELVIITGMSGAGPQHRGQRAGGPRLVRRRQPAAGAAARPSPSSAAARAATSPGSRRRGRRPQPGVLRRPAAARSRSSRARASRRGSSSSRPSDDALVRRFESVRRPHPLQGDGRLLDGIARERELLRDLRGRRRPGASTPSDLNVHELAAKVRRRVRRRGRARRCRPR